MAVVRRALLLLAVLAVAHAKVYFQEEFNDDWENNWVRSNWKEKDGTQGKFVHTAGKWYGDKQRDRGIQTGEDARFYGISAKMSEVFNNEGKDLVLQFSVKHEQKIDCGGAYIKIMQSGTDQATFGGDSDYAIMFGPDICGYTTKKTHVIFSYKGKNLLTKKDVKCETDQLTHLYTLIVHPDKTYEVQIDQKKVESGNLLDDWDFLAPKKIKDPNAKKPADWVDEAEIADPEDKKPEDWDAEPAQIPDPDAKKPDDWDESEDGEWTAPMIDNPKYKGEWKAKMIKNPDYKGPWVHPEIDNPDFKDDPSVGVYEKMEYVGFELWQVKAGTIFDNIIVTDDVKEAEEFAKKTWKKSVEKEKKMFEAEEKKQKEKEEEERKAAEEARKKEEAKKKEEADDEDDEDDKKEDKSGAHDEL